MAGTTGGRYSQTYGLFRVHAYESNMDLDDALRQNWSEPLHPSCQNQREFVTIKIGNAPFQNHEQMLTLYCLALVHLSIDVAQRFNSLVSISSLMVSWTKGISVCSFRVLFVTAPKARASKMLNLVNYRLKVTLSVLASLQPWPGQPADTSLNLSHIGTTEDSW